MLNKRKNPLVTHLIVGLKNEHGLYKIHTEVSPTQLMKPLKYILMRPFN